MKASHSKKFTNVTLFAVFIVKTSKLCIIFGQILYKALP